MGIIVTFNGQRLNDWFGVSNPKRPLPEFRVVTSGIEDMDGDNFDGITVGKRTCSFEVAVKDKTRQGLQDAARKLMSVFTVRKPAKLTFSDEKDADGIQLVRYAVPTGQFDADTFYSVGKWSCAFEQADPHLYGKERSVFIAANSSSTFGVGGNAEVFPKVVAKTSGSSYRITRQGGNFIQYEGNLGNKTLTLDFDKQTCALAPSDANARGLNVNSRFFEFKDQMTISVTAPTTINWTERWL